MDRCLTRNTILVILERQLRWPLPPAIRRSRHGEQFGPVKWEQLAISIADVGEQSIAVACKDQDLFFIGYAMKQIGSDQPVEGVRIVLNRLHP